MVLLFFRVTLCCHSCFITYLDKIFGCNKTLGFGFTQFIKIVSSKCFFSLRMSLPLRFLWGMIFGCSLLKIFGVIPKIRYEKKSMYTHF